MDRETRLKIGDEQVKFLSLIRRSKRLYERSIDLARLKYHLSSMLLSTKEKHVTRHAVGSAHFRFHVVHPKHLSKLFLSPTISEIDQLVSFFL